MVVEETVSKYHKIFCIFISVIFFFVRSAENQKSLSDSSSSSTSSSFLFVCLLFLFIFFTLSSLYWVSDPVIHSARQKLCH